MATRYAYRSAGGGLSGDYLTRSVPTLTPSIPASIVNERARSDPGLDSCPPTAGRLAVPPEDRATGDEQDRATPSRPGYSGLACGPGATHPTSGTGEATAASPVPPTATLDNR